MILILKKFAKTIGFTSTQNSLEAIL